MKEQIEKIKFEDSSIKLISNVTAKEISIKEELEKVVS